MICSDLHAFYNLFESQPGVIVNDLQGANQVQINTNQSTETRRENQLANQVICVDLHPICRLLMQITAGASGVSGASEVLVVSGAFS